MGYIARTNGGADVLELRVGVLADVPAADQGNWRTVVEIGDLVADPFAEVRYISDIAVAEPNVVMTWTKTNDWRAIFAASANVVMTWTKIAMPAPYAKMRLKDYAAGVRWQKTQAGMTLPSGVRIKTDETSKAKLDQALAMLEKGWVPSLAWKVGPGEYITLDTAAMTGVAQAVAAYEQACFIAEQNIAAEIDAGTITSKAEVDAYAWP